MKDWFIPLSSLIWAGVSIVMLIGVAIAGFVLLKNRAQQFFNVLIMGLLVGAVASILLPSLVSFLINVIPGSSDYFSANPTIEGIVSLSLQVLFEFGGILIGYLVLKRSLDRYQTTIEIGEMITFGFAYFAVTILMGSLLSYAFEYIANAVSINSAGVEGTIAGILAQEGNTYTEADIREALEAYAATDAKAFVYSGLISIFSGVISTCMAVICYGAFTKKLDKKFHILYTLECVFFVLPNILGFYIELSEIVYTLISFAITALAVLVTVWIIKTYFAEEWKRFIVKKDNNKGGFGGFGGRKEEPKKMPKIVMPD